jgi:hypothetical protein
MKIMKTIIATPAYFESDSMRLFAKAFTFFGLPAAEAMLYSFPQ